MERSSLSIVLAAGDGTRMRSSLAKVLNPIAGEPILAHVLANLPRDSSARVAVVVAPHHQSVAETVRRLRPDAVIFVQKERLGTAHAVLQAAEAIAAGTDDVLIVFGDTPLITAATLQRLRAPLAQGRPWSCLAFAQRCRPVTAG